MSNYRRLISYIYAYEGEIKGKNIGFAKLEARNGQCKIQVNVKHIFDSTNDIGVYLLSGGQKISIGKIFIRSGNGEFRTVVKVDNVENSGIGLNQIHGLTLHDTGNSWISYTTIWEDAVAHAAQIDLEEVTSEKCLEKQLEAGNTAEEEPYLSIAAQVEAEVTREMEMEEVMQSIRSQVLDGEHPFSPDDEAKVSEDVNSCPQIEAVNAEIAEESELSEGSYADAEEGAAEPEQLRLDMPTQRQKSPASTWLESLRMGMEQLSSRQVSTPPKGIVNATSVWTGMISPVTTGAKIAKPSFMQSQAVEKTPDNDLAKMEGSDLPEDMPIQGIRAQENEAPPVTPAAADAPEPAKNMFTQNSERLARIDQWEASQRMRRSLWDSLRGRYPKIQAFDYENGCEILTIKPQDIGLLPMETWVFGNNSFLLHGYYNYRYLILAKLIDPEGLNRYLLGVPGHYYNSEKYMASMFGFSDFVLSKNQPVEDGRFGYWYTDVKLDTDHQ